jgi:hypothetical protein
LRADVAFHFRDATGSASAMGLCLRLPGEAGCAMKHA